MAAESLAELRDWLFLLLLCLTLLAEVLELAAAAIAMETGEGGEEGAACPSVCRCDEGFVYCNDRGLSTIPPLPLMAAILYLQSNRLSNAGLPPSLERSGSIRVVYLYANQLDEFPVHLPPSLKELHLQDNNIRTLPRSSLARLPLLERLHLDDNSISTVSIQERAFSGTPRLRLLFLSRNHLSSIPAGLPASLEELRLDDNRISTIPTHAFRGLSSLRRLVLDGNLLANTRIADDTFTRLANLTELSLVRNALQGPPVRLPAGQLLRLHLQDNGMTHVPRGALEGMRRLQRLDLSGNNLTSLPRGLLRDAEGLEMLLLRGNPWHCGCNLRWLHAWLHGRGAAVTVRGLTCQSPEAVHGQALRDLTGLMEQCEGPPIAAGAGAIPAERGGGGNGGGGGGGDGAGGGPASRGEDPTASPHSAPTQGSLFTLRAKRPGPAMPPAPGGGGQASGEALELAVRPVSPDSVLVTWLCPRPAPSFRLSWLRLGSSAALGSITETLVPGERQQYRLTQLTPRSHYLICLLPLRQDPSTGPLGAGSDAKTAAPACAQIETGEPPAGAGAGAGGEGSDKEGRDTELTVLPMAGIIGGATALVSLLLIFGIFCWCGQRAGYVSSDAGSYSRGRGGAKHYDDYVESGTKKDTSILEIRAPPAGFQMTAMAHQPLQPKLEDVTYIHTIFPPSSSSSSHANGTYRSAHGVVGPSGSMVSPSGRHPAGYGTNRGYREGGVPDIDYAYT